MKHAFRSHSPRLKTLFAACCAAVALIQAQADTAASAAAQTASEPASTAIGLPQAGSASGSEIAAKMYAVKDLQSGQILLQQGINESIAPASFAKLMTAYLAFQALENGTLKPEQMLTVSERAWKAEGARMFLERGKTVGVGDLVKGLAVLSANDAAVVLAETLAGSEAAFADKMNAEARRLGMTQTHFADSTGNSEANRSSIADLLLLAEALIRDFAQYYPLYSLKSFEYNGIAQPSRNLLIYRDPMIDGLATAQHGQNYNLIASSRRNDRRVVSLVIGSDSEEVRSNEAGRLLNYAVQQFDTPKMYAAGEGISSVKVFKGSERRVAVGFLQDEYLSLPRDALASGSIKPLLETRQPVLAPIKKGQPLGTLKLMHGEQVLIEKIIVALEDVDEANFLVRWWDSLMLWLGA